MSTNVQEDEPRVDGKDLLPLTEPGSDELLSDEVRERIAQVVRDWVAARGNNEGMSDQTVDPEGPDESEHEQREREARERAEREEDDRRQSDESAGDDDPEASDKA
jgi:hypothetical protein